MPRNDPERALNSYIWSHYQPLICVIHFLADGTFDISVVHSHPGFGDGSGDYVQAKGLNKADALQEAEKQRRRGARIVAVGGLFV